MQGFYLSLRFTPNDFLSRLCQLSHCHPVLFPGESCFLYISKSILTLVHTCYLVSGFCNIPAHVEFTSFWPIGSPPFFFLSAPFFKSSCSPSQDHHGSRVSPCSLRTIPLIFSASFHEAQSLLAC